MPDLSPAEARADWIAALRSGNYQQGTGKLCDTTDNTYCCLGVLVDRAITHGVIDADRVEWTDPTLADYPEVIRWVGLNSEEGDAYTPPVERFEEPLTARNDRGDPFERIAEVLEHDDWMFFHDC